MDGLRSKQWNFSTYSRISAGRVQNRAVVSFSFHLQRSAHWAGILGILRGYDDSVQPGQQMKGRNTRVIGHRPCDLIDPGGTATVLLSAPNANNIKPVPETGQGDANNGGNG